jgi:RHS repeat-associated protein
MAAGLERNPSLNIFALSASFAKFADNFPLLIVVLIRCKDSYIKLIYLRSRDYSPSQGRFLSKDTWHGDYSRPLSLNGWNYVEANPVNRIDPAGNSPFFPPDCLVKNAQDCVNLARWEYSKHGPIWLAGEVWGGRFDCSNESWSLPVNARELLADYICERGPERISFKGSDPLTKELANARIIDDIRKRFYQEGDVPKPGEPTEFRFNLPQYLVSLNDILISGEYLPITHFLGSFDYKVFNLRVNEINYDRVHFSITNRTDLASATHIPGLFPPESQKANPLSLEAVINANPVLKLMPAMSVISTYRDQYGNSIVSLLNPKRRSQTGGLGGGNLEQTFAWTERRLDCGLERLPWPVILELIDVR